MIDKNDRVTLHYSLQLSGREVVESTFNDEPITYNFGSGDFPELLERHIASLKLGEEESFAISASDNAFGLHDGNNVHAVARSSFADLQYSVGAIVDFDLPSGEAVSGRVVSMDDESVMVDFNNPLIGQDVICRIKLLAVDKPEN